MKLIYYSTAYHSSHGGSVQSASFLREARRHSDVGEVLLFPVEAGTPSTQTRAAGRLRAALRKSGLMQIVFFCRRTLMNLRPLVNLIKRENPDAILIQTDSTFLQIGYLKRRFPGLTIGTLVNASPFDEPFKNIALRRVFQRLERRSLGKADCNFFVARHLLNRIMQDEAATRRDFVVRNGVDVDAFDHSNNKVELRKQHGLPEKALIVGYLGTLDAHKDVSVLVQAFAAIAQRYPAAHLVVIGDGPDRTPLVNAIRSLRLTGKVTLTGWIDHSRVAGLLNCFDIAVHHKAAAYMDPMKLYEYLSCGLPVIGPDVPAVREVFTQGEHLLLTDGTQEDLTEKLIALIENPALRTDIARTGRAHIRSSFTWERHAHLIIARLIERLGRPQHRATGLVRTGNSTS